MRRTVGGRELTANHRHRRPGRLAALSLGLALAGTGGLVPPAAADAWSPPVPLAGAASGHGPSARLVDCASEDIEIDPRHGVDDRCETWAAVYDDSELYDNSLSTYAQEPTAADDVLQMAVSPAGDRVFTFGRSCRNVNPQLCRWAVVAHRAETGDELWVAHEWATGQQELWPAGIAVSSDVKRVYATGQFRASRRAGDWDPLVNTDVLTIAWDAATGQKLWQRTYSADPIGHREGDRHDLHSGDGGVALAVDPASDRIYVTGYIDNRDTYYDVSVIAYDGRTGTRRWVATHDTSTSDRPYVDDRALPGLAQVSHDGTTLYLAASTGPDVRLLAYQAHDPQAPGDDGTLRWTREIVGTPLSLDLAPDGSRIYLRESPDRIAAYEAATGFQAWPGRPRYHGGDGIPTDLAVSPQADLIVVTGVIPGVDDARDYGTIAYDAATGQQIWLRRYDGSSPHGQRDDRAAAVGVSPDGVRVYVTGVSTTAGVGVPDAATGRQVTVAYHAETGDQLWVAVYNRSLAAETGGHLSVGPDGTVFTASHLVNSDPNPTKNIADWGVQAYEP